MVGVAYGRRQYICNDVNCSFSWKNDVGEAETSILLQENIRFVVTVMKEEAMYRPVYGA